MRTVELYAAAFLARCQTLRSRGQPLLAEAGLHGVLSVTEDPDVRLLVTDDQAYDALAALLPDAHTGTVRTFETAERCSQLVATRLQWSSDTVTAMVSADLDTVPPVSLPDQLTLSPVQRSPADPCGGVALTDAVAAAMSAAPSIESPPEVFAEYLRSLPPTFRLFAALDDDGQVRATSGCGVFGQYATVIFVNTDPGWRSRGIGQAMTAQALYAAQSAGARCACLDASDAGLSIYRRLGFESAGRLRRFMRKR